MIKSRKVQNSVLCILAIASVYGTFSGSMEPVPAVLRGSTAEHWLVALHNGNSIVFNLSVGYLMAVFFWWLVVYVPESQRKGILKANLTRRYSEFKQATIQTLLWAAGVVGDVELPRRLCDHREFKEFFSANEKRLWYAALDGLQRSEERLNELLFELECLAEEIRYILAKVSIEEERVHSFFKRLEEQVFRLKSTPTSAYDHVKYLGGFLWEIHAQWSIVGGQQDRDIIRDMIDAL